MADATEALRLRVKELEQDLEQTLADAQEVSVTLVL